MKPWIINSLLAAFYLVGGFAWLRTGSLYVAAAILAVMVLIMRVRRPGENSSILLWRGLWIPLYLP